MLCVDSAWAPSGPTISSLITLTTPICDDLFSFPSVELGGMSGLGLYFILLCLFRDECKVGQNSCLNELGFYFFSLVNTGFVPE